MEEPFDEPAVDENPFGGNEAAETKEVEIPVPKPRQTTEPAIASSHGTSSPSFSEVKISTTEAFPSLFEITVSDPEKKGEGINAYVIYTINTKTTSPDFLQPSMSVPRRFNNFAWLYTQLTSKHPGVIVPPIPDKQALGRFDATFLDQRRAALEKCLRRIAAHPTLCKSPEFKLFVEAQDLEGEIKKREPKKSLFSALTSSVTDAVQTATQSFSKIPESDEWFENKRAQIETLESQLKLLLKSLEAFVKHRRDLAAASGDFGEHSTSLGNSEFNKPLASCLSHLGDIQKKIQEILNVQADADEHNVEYVVEEYLRIISSVKVAMETRVKHYSAWKSADAALIKKKEQLAKLQQQPNKSSKLPALEAEAEEAEKSVEAAKKQFEDISDLLKRELSRFDKEKIEDFQSGLLKFVETMIESQKKVIHLWEEYLPEVQGL